MSFDPNEHLTQLKSKQGSQDYLEVKWRLVWFRDRYPNGTIDTEEVEVDLDRVVEAEAYVWNAEKRRSEKVMKQAKGYARFRTVATNGEGGRSTGTKSESAADFPDYIEKAETGSIGRALAGLGFGTQFTGDELAEHHRIVDSPVDSPTDRTPPQDDTPATDEQKASIRKLCEHLVQPEPVTLNALNYTGAKRIIAELTAKYQEQQQPTQEAATTAPPSEVDKLRARFSAAYHVKDEDFEARWTRYKVYLLSKDVADPDLDQMQRARINGDLVKEERRIATANKKAS